jgi:hypothetical protein
MQPDPEFPEFPNSDPKIRLMYSESLPPSSSSLPLTLLTKPEWDIVNPDSGQ